EQRRVPRVVRRLVRQRAPRLLAREDLRAHGLRDRRGTARGRAHPRAAPRELRAKMRTTRATLGVLAVLALASCTRHDAPLAAPPAAAPPPLLPAPAPAPAPEAVPDPAAAAAPAPAPTPPAPKPERKPGAYANLDPDDDFVVGPPDALPDCE